jgi:hypothetical protein
MLNNKVTATKQVLADLFLLTSTPYPEGKPTETATHRRDFGLQGFIDAPSWRSLISNVNHGSNYSSSCTACG